MSKEDKQELIESYLEAQGISPTIANEVTEEVGMPLWHYNEYSKEMHPDPCGEWVRADTALFAIERAIASDRASRQVANKAEVELILQARSPEGDPWQEVSGEDFFKAHINGYEVSVCVNAPGKNSIRLEATPPATTGASTENDQAAEPSKTSSRASRTYAYVNEQVRKNMRVTERKGHSVGASTVLTDEREAFEKWFSDNRFGGMRDSMWAAWEARAEVAAQAGQVAVPAGWKLVPVKPTDEMLSEVVRDDDVDEGLKGLFKTSFAKDFEKACLAAPSPAKE